MSELPLNCTPTRKVRALPGTQGFDRVPVWGFPTELHFLTEPFRIFIEHTGPRGTARSCTESEAGMCQTRVT